MKPAKESDGSFGNLTGAHAVARVISQQEKPIALGIPGGYAAYIFDALYSEQDKIETHLVRQESIATVMAEARGRLTGSPAFVIAQGAWVLGNAGIGVMEAHLGASPMVLLIDATDGGNFSHLGPYQGGLGSYGAYDLPAAMKAITKETYVATSPIQALQMTQLAIKHATTGEPGPVAVIFNAFSLRKTINPKSTPPAFPDRSFANVAPSVASDEALKAAADLIAKAKNPVIIAGNGVRLARAEALLAEFASEMDIPVATTPAGKGVIGEDHPLATGVIGGFGHTAANKVVGEADVILALGTKLGATDTAHANPVLIDPHRQQIAQIDIEPLNISWTFPVDAPVQGDLLNALPRLNSMLSDFSGGGANRVTTARDGTAYFDRPFNSSRGNVSPRDVVRVMSESLPPETVVTCDAGENRLFVLRDFQSKSGGTVLQPNGGGGMGYALPAAMAAAMTYPGRQAVAVCGDGGIAMSFHALMSAVELGLKMTVVVLDNGVLGWVYSGQGNRTIASEFKDFDYAAVADAMDCHATKVDDLDDFKAALNAAVDREGVSLIVAKVNKDDRYQDILAEINRQDIYATGSR